VFRENEFGEIIMESGLGRHVLTRLEHLSLLYASADYQDGWIFGHLRHVAPRHGTAIKVRHAVWATQGMTVAESVALWDSL